MLDDIDRNQITREEAMPKLREAVFRTKGKCNNDTALRIAMRKDATVEDVIRLGAYNKVETNKFNRPLGGSPRSMFKIPKARRIEDKRKVMFKDTIVWKYLESKGLTKLATEKYGLDKAYASDCRLVGTPRAYFNNLQRGLMELMNFAKIADNETIANNESISAGLLKVDHSLIPDQRKTNSAFVDFYDGREEFFQAEIDWLNHAPQEILDRLNPTVAYASMTQCMWNMQGTVNSGNENDMTAFKAREYARQMAQFMKYMGIGVAGIGGYSWGIVRNRKNTQALAKYMMTLKNKFDQMIKKGFEVSVVREETVNMLNNWVATKCVINWVFYIRTDAPADYPELAKQQKVNKLHRSGSASPTVVTVPDEEATVIKINGRELKFNRKEAR